MRATYTRIYADDDGISHFEELAIELLPGYVPHPADPLHVAAFHKTEKCSWIGGPPGWDGEAPHPSPGRVLYVTLRGGARITAGDGISRDFLPGDVLLAEDTWGSGHSAEVTGPDGFISLVFALSP